LSTVPVTEPAGEPPPERPERPDRPAGPRTPAIPPAAQPFQGARAGLVSRVLANSVDFIVVVAIVAGGYAAFAALRFLWNSRTFTFPAAPFGLLLLLGSIAMVLYLTGSWMATGRTYGDHLLGLRVTDSRGRLLRLGRALVRAVLCVLFPIGLFWVLLSRENRSVQDLVLRTAVIYDWSAAPQDLTVRPAGSGPPQ
jgi:uncharacterized RDD family membrane protein YckC